MIIKVILSIMFLFLIIYAYRQRSYARFVAEFMVVAALLGTLLVWFPQIATAAAMAVGVGRGADLVLYIFVAVALVVVFVIHLRLRALNYTLTLLARNIALSSPELPERLTKKGAE